MSVWKNIFALLLAFAACSESDADDAQYQRAMASAVRAASGRVLPSVVMIEIIGTSEGGQGEVEQDAPTSGAIVDVDGDVAYVIASSIVASKPAASILVVLSDGTRETAKVVARDEHRDLVLLEIKTDKPLVGLPLDHAVKRQVGQTTIAVGRYGNKGVPLISTGILSAEGRLDGIAIQTDARVSASLYGAPLVDLYGNVLGILIPAVAEGGAESSTDWYDSGVAFAIPAEVIAQKLDRLKSGQAIKKGLLGIVAKSKDPNELNTEIAAVRIRSPAEAAGIRAGDRVLSVNGIEVKRQQGIRQVLGSFDAGEVVPVKVQRAGKTIEMQVTLADTIPPLEPQRLGVIVKNNNGEPSLADVVPGSPAADSLKAGDVILKINDVVIDNADTLRRQLISAQPDEPLSLTYQRGEATEQASVVPQTIGGVIDESVPASWRREKVDPWPTTEIKLPEAANTAFYVAPKSDDGSWTDMGLLVLLLGPGDGNPEATADDWKQAAQTAGVVVCVVAPEDSSKWQPKELEVVASFAAAMTKKAAINPVAVAVASVGGVHGNDATAADSMALAAAISQSKTFFGVAVSGETRPPAVRLRENEPSASLQVMMPVENENALPTWSASIKSAGYPVVLGGKIKRLGLLDWVRLLQAI
ncbi:Periplasmic serine endoprotease DegP precursor [Rubripirellula tenax]|uniref:Periplasmic serine endoprotease DegP n=1 Tax=Rubripirellula tenax TaxID=2528015 RepID=A0A5C6FKE1_9BACT|nr:PDZ domain-containing protein [Rubripirellula tenax]TWU60539.1 Periplasmic serine endoprotease DegP precursor [Rubripirellula tenax]